MKENKTLSDSFAISLEYEGSSAPKVTAKGKGYLAQEIINTAKENNIPIQSDPNLVGLLSQVELNQEIPEALYEAVGVLGSLSPCQYTIHFGEAFES